MDKQARKLNTPKEDGAEDGEEHGSNEDSDHDEKVSALQFIVLFLCSVLIHLKYIWGDSQDLLLCLGYFLGFTMFEH